MKINARLAVRLGDGSRKLQSQTKRQKQLGSERKRKGNEMAVTSDTWIKSDGIEGP
jgi:hypothetical protein